MKCAVEIRSFRGGWGRRGRCIGVGESVVKGTPEEGCWPCDANRSYWGVKWQASASIGYSVRSSRSVRQFMTIGIAASSAVTRSRNGAGLLKFQTRHLTKLVQLAEQREKGFTVVSACNELPDRNNPPVLHLRLCKARFSSRCNDAVPSRFYLDSLDGI